MCGWACDEGHGRSLTGTDRADYDDVFLPWQSSRADVLFKIYIIKHTQDVKNSSVCHSQDG